MKYIYSVLEQLDLAGKQLEHVHPSYARFALLLVDNMVELMLHRQCREAVRADDLLRLISEPKYDAKEREKVLGHHIDAKIKFCRKLEIIDQDEFDFIRTAHEYRNELYHVGMRHDDLLYPLAWEYHSLACILFAKLKVRGYEWRTDDQRSEAARKHWPTDASPFLANGSAFSYASASLLATKPPLLTAFADQVATYATRAVQDVDDALDFLVHENPNRLSEAEVLQDVQFNGFIRSEAGEIALGLPPKPSPDVYLKRVTEVRANWTAAYKLRPTPRWRRRAEGLARLSSSADVLRRYVSLRNEMKRLEGTVFGAAADLDGWIQHQIDVARGK